MRVRYDDVPNVPLKRKGKTRSVVVFEFKKSAISWVRIAKCPKIVQLLPKPMSLPEVEKLVMLVRHARVPKRDDQP